MILAFNNNFIRMDAAKCKALADLCDSLTTSGEPELDQKKLKEVKKICRQVLILDIEIDMAILCSILLAYSTMGV